MSARRSLGAALVVTALAGSDGCTYPRTEIVVRIVGDTPRQIDRRIEAVRVSVFYLENTALIPAEPPQVIHLNNQPGRESGVSAPVAFGVVPRFPVGAAGRAIEVSVEALAPATAATSAQTIYRYRAGANFLPGQTLVLTVPLIGACVDLALGAGIRCAGASSCGPPPAGMPGQMTDCDAYFRSPLPVLDAGP